jgi:hypothetical protein
MNPGILVQAGKQLGVHPGNPIGSFVQTFPVGVFAHGGENLAHGPRNAGLIHSGCDRFVIVIRAG